MNLRYKLLLLALLCLPLVTTGNVQAGFHHPGHGFLAAGCAMPAISIGGPACMPMACACCSSDAPPPGTIGETYTRASHPIPEDEHPRAAMLAVRDHGIEQNIQVQRMGGYRMTNGVWLFETTRPLTYCSENIVRVEARQDPNDIQPHKVKFVRLIPGRIVYLDF